MVHDVLGHTVRVTKGVEAYIQSPIASEAIDVSLHEITISINGHEINVCDT